MPPQILPLLTFNLFVRLRSYLRIFVLLDKYILKQVHIVYGIVLFMFIFLIAEGIKKQFYNCFFSTFLKYLPLKSRNSIPLLCFIVFIIVLVVFVDFLNYFIYHNALYLYVKCISIG